jgi:hypothetical protein
MIISQLKILSWKGRERLAELLFICFITFFVLINEIHTTGNISTILRLEATRHLIDLYKTKWEDLLIADITTFPLANMTCTG